MLVQINSFGKKALCNVLLVVQVVILVNHIGIVKMTVHKDLMDMTVSFVNKDYQAKIVPNVVKIFTRTLQILNR